MVGEPVGERGAVVEDVFVIAISTRRPLSHRLGEGLVLGPRLQHLALDLGEKRLGVDLGIGGGRI